MRDSNASFLNVLIRVRSLNLLVFALSGRLSSELGSEHECICCGVAPGYAAEMYRKNRGRNAMNGRSAPRLRSAYFISFHSCETTIDSNNESKYDVMIGTHNSDDNGSWYLYRLEL